ncbi:glycoside hydrolase family 16 protein [Macrolepiota fuliginosa MF-IS2]|uniref:Glycoside hydrolase family 16 protein n=1 Tax=Macrolepiota fuliginosa MF-IS2 TaxID=1400762 RepID=A0A9P5XMC1_9AGAR|nr:glycoside hydrolase family 16 protein [Macrolepiota fuliginosa MF-IS2]
MLGSLVLLVQAETYDMVKEYAGTTFFNEWTFYDHFDNLTNGDVQFLGATEAASAKLAFVDPATNHAIIKVDNTSTVPDQQKRNSVRIQTNVMFAIGSLWTVDMLHVPYGCSVWPAFWSHSPNWPTGGEIDTFEAVNLQTRNQMSLHTLPGCKQVSPNQSANTTFIPNADCSFQTNMNEGCNVLDPNTASYGAAFSQAGGGVWITEFAETGISIWFMPRANVPSAVSSNSSTIDTSTLGTPVANWPTGGCDMDTFFGPQNIIFDITLCGDLADAPGLFAQTCPGMCYESWVVGNGSNYATAYFEIASMRVFSKTGTNTIIDPSKSGAASALTASSSGLLVYVTGLFSVGIASWLFGW